MMAKGEVIKDLKKHVYGIVKDQCTQMNRDIAGFTYLNHVVKNSPYSRTTIKKAIDELKDEGLIIITEVGRFSAIELR